MGADELSLEPDVGFASSVRCMGPRGDLLNHPGGFVCYDGSSEWFPLVLWVSGTGPENSRGQHLGRFGSVNLP